MNKYKSLLWREIKIAKKNYLGRSMVILAFGVMVFLASLIASKDDFSDFSSTDLMGMAYMFSFLVSFCMMADNEVDSSDDNVGWTEYSYVLPISYKNRAITKFIIRICSVLIGLIICIVFSLFLKTFCDINCFWINLNLYISVALLAILGINLIFCIKSYIPEEYKKIFFLLVGIVAVVAVGIGIFILLDKLPGLKDIKLEDLKVLVTVFSEKMGSALLTLVLVFLMIPIFIFDFFITKNKFERKEKNERIAI